MFWQIIKLFICKLDKVFCYRLTYLNSFCTSIYVHKECKPYRFLQPSIFYRDLNPHFNTLTLIYESLIDLMWNLKIDYDWLAEDIHVFLTMEPIIIHLLVLMKYFVRQMDHNNQTSILQLEVSKVGFCMQDFQYLMWIVQYCILQGLCLQ